MTARTHDLAAISALGYIVSTMPPRPLTLTTVIVAVIANQIGGIAPDIDQPTAPLWRNLPIGKYIGKLAGKMTGGHRFITHSLVGLVLFGLASQLLLKVLSPIMSSIDTGYVWWAFMIGVVSHLLLDTITKEGVPWLLPIPVKIGFPPLKALRITTGKMGEKSIFVFLLIVDVWYVSVNYPALVAFLHSIQ